MQIPIEADKNYVAAWRAFATEQGISLGQIVKDSLESGKYATQFGSFFPDYVSRMIQKGNHKRQHQTAHEMLLRLMRAGVDVRRVIRHHTGEYTAVLNNTDFDTQERVIRYLGFTIVKSGYGLAYGYPTHTPAIRFTVPNGNA